MYSKEKADVVLELYNEEVLAEPYRIWSQSEMFAVRATQWQFCISNLRTFFTSSPSVSNIVEEIRAHDKKIKSLVLLQQILYFLFLMKHFISNFSETNLSEGML